MHPFLVRSQKYEMNRRRIYNIGKQTKPKEEIMTGYDSDVEGTKLSIEFFVAGVKFRKGWKENLEALEEGQELILVPEPTNKFDKYAIKIMSPEGVMLGYVPAKTGEALILSQAITSGKRFKATATELAVDFEPWRALQVLVEEVT